ncbi:MAG: hypothetical protein SH848_21220 [Saprospiraceae bacterium]|nr:hypothetical protein [Saprospiraceae bacterium]MDZ4706464.1 hypothetical protein [Saprospiraceae bacterium]
MMIFEAYINNQALAQVILLLKGDLHACNQVIRNITGIVDFFDSKDALQALKAAFEDEKTVANEPDRSEYGDFQTNVQLSQWVCDKLREKGIQPKVVIEPTFGKGNFILAALKTFPQIEKIIGVEIYKPYVWQTKFSLLEYFLTHPNANKPIIELHHQSVFDFEFDKLAVKTDVLILGNPPWVTNSMLSSLGSDNLPPKSNFKNHSGFDALTGKGNFDIGEYISLMLIKAFQNTKGNMAFLVKNAVIKNILLEQKRNQYQITGIEKQTIDAQKEFNVAVDAALFFAQLGLEKAVTCAELDFYSGKPIREFGWVGGKFIANIGTYAAYADVDGTCPFEWRQGVKHDCSKVMELESENDRFVNGRGEEVVLEPDLVYGLLKSSDLKQNLIETTRKNTIITQRKIGQDTAPIQSFFPKTWVYLMKNKEDFNNRKSSIYKGKPMFSIFGIGDYSFAPYKVAISGMYKTAHFSVVLPQNGKPVMLDDTCYFIGFEQLQDALISQAILNSTRIRNFLNAIVFWDSKRVITKDLLSRIDLAKAAKELTFQDLNQLNPVITFEGWETYMRKFEPSSQLTMF